MSSKVKICASVIMIICMAFGFLPMPFISAASSVIEAIAEDVQAGMNAQPISEVLESDGWLYRICADDDAELMGYEDVSAVQLRLPAQVDGHWVTRIGSNAFASNTSLTSVQIPAQVAEVSKLAFPGANRLSVSAYNGTAGFRFAKQRGLLLDNLSKYDLFDDITDLSDLKSSQWNLSGSRLTLSAPYTRQITVGAKLFLPPTSDYRSGMPVQVVSTDSGAAQVNVLGFMETIESYSARCDDFSVDYDNVEILMPGVNLIRPENSSMTRPRSLSSSKGSTQSTPISPSIINGHELKFEFACILPHGLKITGSWGTEYAYSAEAQYENHQLRRTVVSQKETKFTELEIEKEAKKKKTFIDTASGTQPMEEFTIPFVRIPLISSDPMGLIQLNLECKLEFELSGEITLKSECYTEVKTTYEDGQVFKTKNTVDRGTTMEAAVSGSISLSGELSVTLGLSNAKNYIKVVELKAELQYKVSAEYSTLSPVCIDFTRELTFGVYLKAGILEIQALGKNYLNGGAGGDFPSAELVVFDAKVLEIPIPLKKLPLHFEIPTRKWVYECTMTDNKYSLVTFYATFNETFVQSVLTGECVEEPPSPGRDGYTFDGWYTADTFEDDEYWDFDEPVEDTMTLYAKWIDNMTGEVLRPDDMYDGTTGGADDLEYETRQDSDGNDYLVITGLKKCVSSLRIPGMINGLPVKKLESLYGHIMLEDENGDYEWIATRDSLKHVIVEEGIEEIDDSAFYDPDDNHGISYLKLPSTLKKAEHLLGDTNWLKTLVFAPGTVTIPSYIMYENNSNDVQITLPDSVQTIETHAFGKTSFTSIDLPYGLKEIKVSAFENSSLVSIQLPATLERIERAAFRDSKLKEVELPASLRYLEAYAFSAETLTSVGFPKNLGDIECNSSYQNGPFAGSGLKRIKIQNGITQVPNYLFDGCKNLESIELPDSLESLGSISGVGIRAIHIPDGITQIHGFYDCPNLKSINIPAGVTEIGNFEDCPKLKSIVLPEGMTVLPHGAFMWTDSIEEVILPSTLSYIESGVCSKSPIKTLVFPARLEKIDYDPWSNTDTFFYAEEAVFQGMDTEIGGTGVLGTVKKVYCYADSSVDRYFKSMKEDGYYSNAIIICMPKDHFTVSWCMGEQGPSITSTRVRAGDLLDEPQVEPNAEYILEGWYSDSEFTHRWDFDNDIMPNHSLTLFARWVGNAGRIVYTINDQKATVTGFNGIAPSLIIPPILGDAPVTGLADGAIPDTLTHLTLPASLTDIDSNAFRFASGLQEIDIATPSISKRASGDVEYRAENGVLFSGNTLLCYPCGKTDATFTLPEGVTTIGENAIMSYESLETLVLPAKVILEKNSIIGCPALTRVNFSGDCSSVGTGSFSACSFDLNLSGPIEAPVLRNYAEANHLKYNQFALGYINDGKWLSIMRMSAGETLPVIIPETDGSRYFAGWSAKGPEGPIYEETTMPLDDLVLYAVFREAFDMEAYNNGIRLLKYNGNDDPVLVPNRIEDVAVTDIAVSCFNGTDVTSLRGEKGSVAEAFATQNGLTFIPLSHKLTFETQGGTQFPSRDLCATDPIDLPETIRYSYSFTGWYLDEYLNEPWPEDGTMPAHDLTLYAGWQRVDNENFVPYTFITEEDGLVITGYTGDYATAVVPDAINGLPVKAIGQYAFAGDTKMISVTVSAGIHEIHEAAFADSMVGYVELQGAITIGDNAFADCLNLSQIVLPDTLTAIGESAFTGCGSLLHLTLPNGIETMGRGTFSNCAWLSSVTLPTALEEIPQMAFSGCAHLRRLTIPSGVNEIATDAFDGCTTLTAFEVASGNMFFRANDGVLFNRDGTQLMLYPTGKPDAEYIVPSGVSHIAESAMANCRLINLTLPDGVISIADQAVRDASQLETLSLGNTLTTIGSEAFGGCLNLKNVTLPESISNVGNKAFRHTGLGDVTVPPTVILGNNAFPDGNVVTIFSTAGSAVEDYATAHKNRFVDVTRDDVPVSDIILEEDSLSLIVGETVELTASLLPLNTTETEIEWYSDDAAVAWVDQNGMITARSIGETTITAIAADGSYAECLITVVRRSNPAAKLELSRSSITVQVGSLQSLTARLLPAGSDWETITWSSTNEQVAIWSNNEVYGLSIGEATLTASTESGLSASCLVTVQLEELPVPSLTGMTLILPSDLKTVDEKAFQGIKISKIYLPYGLEEIHARAFECPTLRVVYIPETVTYIDPTAFGDDLSQLTVYYNDDYWDTAAQRFVEENNVDSCWYEFYPGYEHWIEDDD